LQVVGICVTHVERLMTVVQNVCCMGGCILVLGKRKEGTQIVRLNFAIRQEEHLGLHGNIQFDVSEESNARNRSIIVKSVLVFG